MAAGPLQQGVAKGCFIGFAIFAILVLLGKCAEWTGAV